jgi:hypothetical protein
MSEHLDRKVLMSETLLRYLIKKAYPDDIVQIRFCNPPVAENTTYWEPVITVAWRDTTVAVQDSRREER